MILKFLDQLSEWTKMELGSKELFGPQLFCEMTLQASIDIMVLDVQYICQP